MLVTEKIQVTWFWRQHFDCRFAGPSQPKPSYPRSGPPRPVHGSRRMGNEPGVVVGYLPLRRTSAAEPHGGSTAMFDVHLEQDPCLFRGESRTDACWCIAVAKANCPCLQDPYVRQEIMKDKGFNYFIEVVQDSSLVVRWLFDLFSVFTSMLQLLQP